MHLTLSSSREVSKDFEWKGTLSNTFKAWDTQLPHVPKWAMKIRLVVSQEAKAFPGLPISQNNLTRQTTQVSINLDMPHGEGTRSSRHYTHIELGMHNTIQKPTSLLKVLYTLSSLRHIVVSSTLMSPHPLNKGKGNFKSNQLHTICDLTKLHKTNFSYARGRYWIK